MIRRTLAWLLNVALAAGIAFAQDAQPPTAGEIPTVARRAAAHAEFVAACVTALEQAGVGMPTGRPARLDEIVAISLENGHLVGTVLDPTEGDAVVPLSNVAGPDVKAIRRYRVMPNGVELFSLQVYRIDRTTPQFSITHLIFSPSTMQIAFDAETPGSTINSSLIDNAMMRQPGESRTARFIFARTSEQDGDGRSRVSADAQDMQQLLRTSRPMLEQFARPMFESLGDDARLTLLDPRAIEQVTLPFLEVDAETTARVKTLVARLDADSFVEREEALRELQSMGLPAAAVLAGLDPAGLSPEQSVAVQNVLGRVQPLDAAEADARRNDPAYMLDLLLSDNPNVRAIAAARLETLVGERPAVGTSAPATIDTLRKLRDKYLVSR